LMLSNSDFGARGRGKVSQGVGCGGLRADSGSWGGEHRVNRRPIMSR
jgi:hypothetical protein